jgi:hypothetical protein
MFSVIPGIPDYWVYDDGRIFSHFSNKFLSPSRKSRYPMVALTIDGVPTTKYVHRLVAEAFFGKSDLQVNHKDGNRTNNNVENLEYLTQRENLQHGWKTGLIKPHGSKNPSIRYTDAEVEFLKSLKGKMTAPKAVELTGMSLCYVYKVWSGELRTKDRSKSRVIRSTENS